MALVLSAAVSINLTHLQLINKTKHELYVKMTQIDNSQNTFTRQLAPATIDGGEVADTLSILSGTYYVWAWFRTVKFDPVTGARVYGEYKNCYGVIDGLYWDKKRAARVIKLDKGKRNLPFNDKSCQVLYAETYTFWNDLPLKEYWYKLGLFSYQY